MRWQWQGQTMPANDERALYLSKDGDGAVRIGESGLMNPVCQCRLEDEGVLGSITDSHPAAGRSLSHVPTLIFLQTSRGNEVSTGQ